MSKISANTRTIRTSSISEIKRMRREKKRMNEKMGALVFREVFPYRKKEVYNRKRKKHRIHYQIKSVFPDQNSMELAYKAPCTVLNNE